MKTLRQQLQPDLSPHGPGCSRTRPEGSLNEDRDQLDSQLYYCDSVDQC
jgi:hypothetical protein